EAREVEPGRLGRLGGFGGDGGKEGEEAAEDSEEDDDTAAIDDPVLSTTRAVRPRCFLSVASQRRSSVHPPISTARRGAPRHDCRQQTRVPSYPPPWRQPHQPENPRPRCSRR